MAGGRPPLEPTDKDRKQVEALSGFGLPLEQIAILTCGGIDADTLRKHFATELISGKAKANSKVGQTLFQKATGGDTSAMIWWSKTQMGWKETKAVEVEHSGTIDTKSNDEITREAQEIAARLNG